MKGLYLNLVLNAIKFLLKKFVFKKSNSLVIISEKSFDINLLDKKLVTDYMVKVVSILKNYGSNSYHFYLKIDSDTNEVNLTLFSKEK